MQRSRCERYRFSVLMQEMRRSSNEGYLASIVAFINSVLAGAGDLKKRTRLRNELLGNLYVCNSSHSIANCFY